MKKNVSINWLVSDVLEIKIVDSSRRTLYKRKVDINNKKDIARSLMVLEKYGVSIKDLAKIIDDRDNSAWWEFQ